MLFGLRLYLKQNILLCVGMAQEGRSRNTKGHARAEKGTVPFEKRLERTPPHRASSCSTHVGHIFKVQLHYCKVCISLLPLYTVCVAYCVCMHSQYKPVGLYVTQLMLYTFEKTVQTDFNCLTSLLLFAIYQI